MVSPSLLFLWALTFGSVIEDRNGSSSEAPLVLTFSILAQLLPQWIKSSIHTCVHRVQGLFKFTHDSLSANTGASFLQVISSIFPSIYSSTKCLLSTYYVQSVVLGGRICFLFTAQSDDLILVAFHSRVLTPGHTQHALA